jgi:hypothetical protein
MPAVTWIGLVGFVVVSEVWSFVRRRVRGAIRGEVSATWLAEHQRITFYGR